MDVLLLLALAVGISIFFSYAARAAFKADSLSRRSLKKFVDEIEDFVRRENDPPAS